MSDQATTPAAGEAVTPANNDPAVTQPLNQAATDPSTVTDPSDSNAAKPGEGENREDEGKKRNRVPASVRIARLTAERNAYRAKFEESESRAARLSAPPKVDVAAMDYDQREKHRTKEALNEIDLERTREEGAKAREGMIEARDMVVLTKLEAASEQIPGLMEKITAPDFPLTDEVIDFLHVSDKAGEVAAFLADNPKTARQLFEMTFTGDDKRRGTATRDSMREATRYLAQLEAKLEKGKATPVRKTSAAPAPGTTLKGAGTPATFDPKNASQAEYNAEMNRREAAGRA